MRHALAGLPEFYNSIVATIEGGGCHSITRRLWSAVCDKVFECTEHSADRNSSPAVSGLYPHTVRRSTHLRKFGWEVFIHHPPYSSNLAPSDFHLFLHIKKFLSGQRQCFHNGREAEISDTVVQIPGAEFYDAGYKRWPHSMTNVSIPEVNMLKNCSTLAASEPINLFIIFFCKQPQGNLLCERATYFMGFRTALPCQC